MTVGAGFGWIAILRLGAVQASIGAIVMLATSLLKRLMVVEYGLAAAIPAGLVAWHYAVQLLRPVWGQGSDLGLQRTPWILGGMALLGLGALAAVNATVMLATAPLGGTLLAVLGFTMFGGGVGAAGTSMLALLASGVAPERRAAAAATTWIMMVAGIVVSASVAGALLDPYSPARLALVASGVVAVALVVTALAVVRLERQAVPVAHSRTEPVPEFRAAIAEILTDGTARAFTLLIFVSMLAYSMQDLILEPFAGLVFDMTPGESTSLAGIQHGGVLVGMVVTGIGGSGFAGRMPGELRSWIATGCLGSAAALAALAFGAQVGPGWPLTANVFALGFFNGLFAVAAIGAMMGLAGAGRRTREGVRMGVWGASQAIAFGLGGLIGALGVDFARRAQAQDAAAFQLIFAIEAVLFVVAAGLALRVASREAPRFSGVVPT
ncbi:bacteriochlorophyll synthase [Erythrobacter sp. QSSC1-22B]|uniref:BCD family MFS transporter n=1 Tax=Erythrobacter sp. QSSC1-22B TaxID=1860125 RepID=UPI000804D675|nr:BCD family MFS transporter [Erythrobacter sp. QSSC1-22B]OBX20595.1 bacteriochlorophyll synthase [Erythrobacter sp. QSSC1-22B]